MSSSMREELTCPICLQLYLDPVTLPCGHNYCQVCMLQTLSNTDTKLKCPECRLEFPGRESMQKNFKLSNIITGYLGSNCGNQEEKLQGTGQPSAPPADEASCAEKECSIHHFPLVYFCSTDVTLLCSKCFMEGLHQGHELLTFNIAESEMRHALEVRSKVVSNRLQMTNFLVERVKEQQDHSQAVGDKLVNKAITTVEVMARLIEGYRERLQTLLDEKQSQSRSSWQVGVGSLEEQQKLLVDAQQSATEALNMTDSCSFINQFIMIDEKLRLAATIQISCNIPANAPLTTKQLQTGLRTEAFRAEMSRLAEYLCLLFNPLELTFNSSTAHPSLQLSNDLRTAKYSETKQSYTEKKERFTSAPQVMCNEGFSSGEHIWVVEVGPDSMWSLGLCYKSIPRRGDHSRLGHNSLSWRLQWKNGKLTACKSSSTVVLREMASQPLKIEVGLDYEKGTLTFHSIKGQREHLYTFNVAFKETVYPVFSIHSNTPDSWITLQCGL
ncbi:E3 ubiquitin-protein ligase Midline-1 [Syngnathus typhle]|uniref:E3 ubiquitin-protein ligase Midline-1 n=1 Tax=Syngnathus typhle TaxID=161592 RepID=UPI002A6B865E|nr:E3 ubiquitin-protein ligase Midline-1 [Syngnathus typhle]